METAWQTGVVFTQGDWWAWCSLTWYHFHGDWWEQWKPQNVHPGELYGYSQVEVGWHQAYLEVGFAPKLQFFLKLKDAFDHRLHRAGKAFETHRHCNFYLGRADVLRTLLGRETKVLLKDTEWEELPSGPGKCVFLFYFLWTECSELIMSFPCVNHQDRLSGKCTPPSVILRTNFSPAFILSLPVSLDLFLPFFPLLCHVPHLSYTLHSCPS